jgi:hypothetical protein
MLAVVFLSNNSEVVAIILFGASVIEMGFLVSFIKKLE